MRPAGRPSMLDFGSRTVFSFCGRADRFSDLRLRANAADEEVSIDFFKKVRRFRFSDIIDLCFIKYMLNCAESDIIPLMK
jgi:hypothetical protein